MQSEWRAVVRWAEFQIQRMRIRRQFRSQLGYEGNFEQPRSFQEKIQFRKLYGNHEFYASVADKYRVREYVAKLAGENYLIPLLGVYDQLSPAQFDSLPERFIIKANHGCKWHQVVKNKSRLDRAATAARFNRYMKRRYGWAAGEQHYNLIEPKIVVEELLEGNTGGCPWDFCFFSYNTPAGFEYSLAIACPKGRSAIFGRGSADHPGQLLTSTIPEKELAPHLNPTNYPEMVRVARSLSREFDFVRVDLYSVGDRVYFGELTCTPHQGYGRIADPRRQQMRDEMWRLDARNPRLYRLPAGKRLLGGRQIA